MRKVLGAALALTLLPAAADAEDRYLLRQDQTGLTLPGVSLPQGYDEVRASDGTSCRSSNTGAGAYADVGVVGSNDIDGAMNSGSLYGRVVIPLGEKGSRLDCRRLYDLEIQRLQSEVRLLKAGLNGSRSTEKSDESVALEEGWSNSARQDVTDRTTTGSVKRSAVDHTKTVPSGRKPHRK